MSRLEAIFFDHDGTLVDTEPLWAEAKTALAAEFGARWTEQDTLMTLGKPAAVTFARMQELGADVPADELYNRLKAKMSLLLKDARVEFLPGIEALLAQVAEAGVPAGIVTNATTELAANTARLAPAGLFKTLITDEQVTKAKPDPEPYLLAAKHLGVNPANCVAVEDSASGAQSAMAAGMKVVVVPGLTELLPISWTTKKQSPTNGEHLLCEHEA
ncbi:HAD family hydrolase, partial [Rothia nasimurium]|uniref:HAD family hydrolase n=1 Tax=Rothia nasimurium TaxID=85336 RepID=UPI00360F5D9A